MDHLTMDSISFKVLTLMLIAPWSNFKNRTIFFDEFRNTDASLRCF